MPRIFYLTPNPNSALTKFGVEQVIFTPLLIERCKTLPATREQSDSLSKRILDSSKRLNTEGESINNGLIKFTFEPPARNTIELEPIELSTARRDATIIQPLSEPLPEWTVESVPADAAIEPKRLGALTLVGCRIDPDCMVMTSLRLLYVETYWTIDQALNRDCKVRMRGVPMIKDSMPPFGEGMDHQGCDWLYPTERWTPQVIYRERFGLRPSEFKHLVNGELRLEISVMDGDEVSDAYVHPSRIELQIPELPTVELDADGFLPNEPYIEKFKQEIKSNNDVVFFGLSMLYGEPSGLELSSFRRATLFKKYFGCEVCLLVTKYEYDVIDNFERSVPDGKLLSMYDYYQGIDRTKLTRPPIGDDCTIEYINADMRVRRDGKTIMYFGFDKDSQRLRYINFFKDGKKDSCDSFDILGFVSRREKLDPLTGERLSAEYLRPDGSVAIRETYEIVDKKARLKYMEIVGMQLTSHNEYKAVKYWLDLLTADRSRNYFFIADSGTQYQHFYSETKDLHRDNVFTTYVMHSIQVEADFDPMKSKTKSWFEVLVDRPLDKIISLTDRQKNDIIARYGLQNLITLPHAIHDIKRAYGTVDPMKVILVGRLSYQKNPDRAIDMFKLVLKKVPKARLHFFGGGDLYEHIKKRIKDEGLTDSIILEGFCRDIPAQFASAAMSILTSNYEGAPLVIQESLYQGCPMVALDCTYGPSDMIIDGVNGFLVPYPNIEIMADRIVEILLNPELRQRMSENAPGTLKKFSRPVVAAQWAKLFLGLMQEREADS